MFDRYLTRQMRDKTVVGRIVDEDIHKACVAFRLDDVQDFYLSEIQISIVNTFIEEKAKLTVGIIGNAFGNDLVLLNHIRYVTKDKDNPLVRVANHGWNHENMTELRKEDQSLLIKRSNQKICSLLNINPSIFIPPYNIMNDDTISALRENDIPFISSSVKYDPPPYTFQKLIPYRFPMTVSTTYTFYKYWYRISNKKIMNKIRESILKFGFAVILLHPQQLRQQKRITFNW